MKIIALIGEHNLCEDNKDNIFVSPDPRTGFPEDSIKYLKKYINKLSKDLTKEWNSPLQLVTAAFNEANVPIPMAFQFKRWDQYTYLIGVAVTALQKVRGILDT